MDSSKLQLFYNELSQPSRSVFMFIKLLNIPYDSTIIELHKGDQNKPEYLAMNPKHAIPVVKDGDFVITESSAAVIYLATKYKTKDHWYPSDLQKRTRVHEILDWRTAIRKPGIGVMTRVVLGSHVGYPPLEPEKKDAIYKELDGALTVLEWYLKDQKFLCGDEISIADLFVANEVFQPSNGDRDIYETHSKIKDWIERVRQALNPVWDEVINEFNNKLDAIRGGK